MMSFFENVVYIPIYNLVVFLVDTVPGGDLGLAIVLATLLVKFILMPLSLAAARTQKAMRVLEPELKALREKYKDDKEKQAREMFALYKKYKVKPFASIFMLFIQIPIVLGLYFVCMDAASSVVDASLLYSFVPNPVVLSPLFLGIFSVTSMSIPLAIVAGVTQLAQAWYVIPVPPKSTAATPSMQEEFGRALALQARFMLPIVIGLFALTSGVIALYFSASNIFMILQEFIVRQTHKDPVLETV
jgi:YidC/Oxa1 family membrane protein insertase